VEWLINVENLIDYRNLILLRFFYKEYLIMYVCLFYNNVQVQEEMCIYDRDRLDFQKHIHPIKQTKTNMYLNNSGFRILSRYNRLKLSSVILFHGLFFCSLTRDRQVGPGPSRVRVGSRSEKVQSTGSGPEKVQSTGSGSERV
jgi:hypothetical protein